MFIGRLVGLLLMLLGAGLVGHKLLSSTPSPSLMVLASLCLNVGLALTLFPGAPAPQNNPSASSWWRASPRRDRVIWIAAGLLGLVLGLALRQRLS